MTSARPRSIVIGAGLMGRLLAWQLARAGHQVTVHEAGDAQGNNATARVAAAMLAPLAESAITEPSVVRMGQYSLVRWPELLGQLKQPVFFQQEGTLVLWHRQDAAEAQRFAAQLRKTQTLLPDLPTMRTLGSADLQHLEPSLESRFSQGLYLPAEGQLDNRQLLSALVHELESMTIELNWNSSREPEDFSGNNETEADWIFDCRGLGAKPQWPQLRGVRGEVARVQAPQVRLSRPTRLIHPRYPIYIAPKPEQVYVIGATEIESEDFSPPSVRSTLELMSAAYAVDPGFAEARILEINTQCRPTLPDNLPAIRRLGPRSFQINGLYRHGFMIAPALLDITLELVLKNASPLANKFSLEIGAPQ